MSERHPLDQLFHDQLAGSSAAVPDDMWERIQRARPPKRRPPYGRWLGLALVLLLVSGATAYWWQNNASAPTLGQFEVETPVPSAATATEATIRTSQEASADAPVAENETTVTSVISTEKVTTAATATPSTARDGAPFTTAQPTTDVTTVMATPTTEAISGTKVTDVPQELTTVLANRSDEESFPSKDEPQKAYGPHQRRSTKQATAMLPSRSYQLTSATDIKLFANHAPRCAKFTGSLFHVDVELLGGPAYAHAQLTAKTGESQNYLRQRRNSESPRVSYTTTLRLAATTKSGLGIRSGLAYTQINERFEHEVGSRMNIELITHPDGQVTRDTTYQDSYVETTNNRLRLVEVPVLLGYQKQVGRLRVGAQAGAYLGLLFDATGRTYSPASGEPIALGQEGEANVLPVFNQRATAALYGSMTVAYNLASRYSIIAEPYFRTHPRVLSTDGYDLEQNYWMAGLQLGLRMRL
ncbi:MAG: hypothetical protein AAGJ82_15775 [Bacteroidota bacterium]